MSQATTVPAGDSMEKPANGGGKAAEAVDEPIVGPGPAPKARHKRPLQFEHAYLDSLPSANMYAFLLL